MSSGNQTIRVFPDILSNLIIAVQKGDYRIPQFQREYVWEKSKVIDLFDSIYREYPIGSFFLWKADRSNNNLFRHSIDMNIPEIQPEDNVSFILDGQQRITSIYVTLQGVTIRNTDYSQICFDLKEEKFTHRKPDDNRYVRVCDIWGPNAMKIMRKIDNGYTDAFDRCYQSLRTYPISIVEVRDKDLTAVCNIFQRINQGGKRLERFDLISAMTFSPDFDLREKFKSDILEILEGKGFGPISPAIATQIMALVKKGACTERVEYSLTTNEIKDMWKSIVDSILLAVETLRKNCGVKNSEYLPYDAILTLLGYMYAKSGQKALTKDQMDWVKRWFWRASFSQHYGNGGPTKVGRDKDLFDRLLKNESPDFNPTMSLTTETLVSTRMTWLRSAPRNAFLCLLAVQEPLHLVNNSKLDLINGGISDFTSPEKHHIFPQAFLRRSGMDGSKVHALPNFCFLPSELNQKISAKEPSRYFSEIRQENNQFSEAAKSHLLPDYDTSGIAENDYARFLQQRAELIMEKIEQLTGASTAPSEDSRQKAIESMEHRLRDFIHDSFLKARKPNYWTECIPSYTREEVEKRIKSEIWKQPERKPSDYADSREKINFLNPSDYFRIICDRNNWPIFAEQLRRRQEAEHYLRAFADFRNLVMHGRELTEISRKSGELALIWLANILPEEN